LPREAARDPAQSDFCRSVPLNRSLCGGLLVRRRESGSKLGGAHRIRMKLMPEFETEVPEPLGNNLPALLTHCRMACPPVGVLRRTSSSARAFSNAPRCRYSATTSLAVNALWGSFAREQFVDNTRTGDPDPTLGSPGRVRRHYEPTPHSLWSQRQIRAIVEVTHHPADLG
jgi:hypothetical protein